jgi:hypothetical protein
VPPLQKPIKHEGHQGTPGKRLSLLTFVYFVPFVFEDLFAVEAQVVAEFTKRFERICYGYKKRQSLLQK